MRKKSHWACSYPVEFVENNFIKKNVWSKKAHYERIMDLGWLGWFSIFPTKIRGNPNIKEGSLFVFVCIGISLITTPPSFHFVENLLNFLPLYY
jgi:hypothetical protein